MAWNSDTIGGIDDRVELRIGDAGSTHLAESYEVRQSYFTSSPNVFVVKLGTAQAPAQLIAAARPRTKLELFVGGVLQQTGWSDGPEANADAGAGTSVMIHGRDKMAELHDAHIQADKSFSNMSYGDLTEAVLNAALGQNNYDIILQGGNRQNRMAATGSSSAATASAVPTTAPAPGGGTVVTAAPDDIKPALTSAQGRTLRAKFGSKWWEFLKAQLDRAGLFLLCGASGEFILCAPNVTQRPLFRLQRAPNLTRRSTSIERASYKNVATKRYTVYEIHGKKGGGSTAGVAIPPDAPDDVKAALIASAASAGGQRSSSSFVDQEMVDWGYPLTRVWSHKDAKLTSPAQGAYLARFHCAHDRRENWQLTYTVTGHTWPAIAGGERLTWAVDTMVEVDDQEFGLQGNFWIESVSFKRDGGGTHTELHLMRPEDLIFGEPV